MNEPGVYVAIVGGSGAGKSWLAERLQHCFGNHCARGCRENFYRDRGHLVSAKRERINYDHPREMEWARVTHFLGDARAGRMTFLPQYDFKTRTRVQPVFWEPPPTVI